MKTTSKTLRELAGWQFEIPSAPAVRGRLKILGEASRAWLIVRYDDQTASIFEAARSSRSVPGDVYTGRADALPLAEETTWAHVRAAVLNLGSVERVANLFAAAEMAEGCTAKAWAREFWRWLATPGAKAASERVEQDMRETGGQRSRECVTWQDQKEWCAIR